MYLICGIPTEGPARMVAGALENAGAPVVFFNQRRFAEMQLSFAITGGAVTGALAIAGVQHRLEEFRGVYVRLMDDGALPEVQALAPGDARRKACRALHDALGQWIEVAPCRVVNRFEPMGSNSSKPYQAQLIGRHGFRVPETLITNRPELVREFAHTHGPVIYKSASSVRSIVDLLDPEDDERLERIRWCPTQFQAFVAGDDVRVHVVGSRVFAARISSGAVDYRYAHRRGHSAELEAFELDPELAERCRCLARDLNLPFAGIDLKIADDGLVYCFEVNPSPGFSYFEAETGQPIAAAVAAYLMGDD